MALRAGIDVARYTGSAATVTVDLATGLLSGGDAVGDTLSGIDTLDYAGSTDGVVVFMGFGYGYGGDASGDRFTGMENLRGSAFRRPQRRRLSTASTAAPATTPSAATAAPTC